MLIKFIKNIYYNTGAIKYKFGSVYDVEPDEIAKAYIARGQATALTFLPLKPKDAIKPSVRLPLNPSNAFANTAPPGSSEALIKLLGLTPRPGSKIRLAIPDPKTTKYFENKGVVRDTKAYYQNINTPVKEIAGLLAEVLDYAIDRKDSQMIQKVAGDLLTLKRLTEFYNGNRK